VLDELHVTESVIFTVVPSFKVPIASNCWVWLVPIEALEGLTAIELRFATEILTLVEPLMDAEVATTLVVPGATPLTSPPSEIVAMALSFEDQLTEPVMFLVLPSSYVPVAVICFVLPTLTVGVCGVTVTVFSVGSTKNPLQLDDTPTRRRSERSPTTLDDVFLRKKPPRACQ
jgi:hypothetical protein